MSPKLSKWNTLRQTINWQPLLKINDKVYTILWVSISHNILFYNRISTKIDGKRKEYYNRIKNVKKFIGVKIEMVALELIRVS